MPERTAERTGGLGLLTEDLVLLGEAGRVLLGVPRLAVEPGSAMAVRGPSGAGKSTLLHVMAGLVRPDRGCVLWTGDDLTRLSEEGCARFRRRSVGLVPQDAALFEEMDAIGNAAVAAAFAPRSGRAGIGTQAEGWLRRLGLGEGGRRRVSSLSGGERSRVAIARALAGQPDVVLADEPTASLDRAGAGRLAADLAALAGEGRILIVATHDANLMARMGRTLTLDSGRVVEDGRG